VIGVGSALTRETAATFAREGAEVLVVDRDQSTIERVLAEIGTEGGTAYGLATDFMTEPGIRQIADACASRWDRLDILFNGHAAMDFWEFGEETADDWVTILSVNVIAPAMTTKAQLEKLFGQEYTAEPVSIFYCHGSLHQPHDTGRLEQARPPHLCHWYRRKDVRKSIRIRYGSCSLSP